MDEIIRLRLITQNIRLVQARKDKGLTQPEFAKIIGVGWTRISQIENLWVIPSEDEMVKMAVFLEKPVDDLFPEVLLNAVKQGVFHQRFKIIGEPEIQRLIAQSSLISDGGIDAAEEEVDRYLLHEQLDQVMKSLTSQEALVLRERFGFDGGGPKTQEEVGRGIKQGNGKLGVTGKRIQQIESKALRKLRHPSRSRGLKSFYEQNPEPKPEVKEKPPEVKEKKPERVWVFDEAKWLEWYRKKEEGGVA